MTLCLTEEQIALTPDDSLLVHEVIDYLNAVTQLKLRLL